VIRFLTTFLSLVAVVAILSGCGFHLRGQSEEASPLPAYYLDVSDRTFGSELKRQLIQAGGGTASDREGSSVIEITDVATTRVTTTVDAEGRTTGIRLRMELTFRLLSEKGLVLVDHQTLHAQDDLSYDHTIILQMQAKEGELKKSLHQKLAKQLLEKLLQEQANPDKASLLSTTTRSVA
jgi:LPS-assembly lipoprotein|tara:strand:- start:14292 stop:14831 length:540 start_codon:yes stop_codon:yes gene_type:complete